MNKLTTTLGLTAATLVTAGGLFLAPDQQAPAGAAPTTGVPIELVARVGEPVRDGEVTTTVHVVNDPGRAARTGRTVDTDTRAKYTVELADGEYLLKSTPTSGSQLVNVQDIDGTIAVPAGSGCGNLYDCAWIWVADGSWGLHGNPPTVSVAEFQFDRPTPPPTTSTTTTPTTPPPTTAPDAEPVDEPRGSGPASGPDDDAEPTTADTDDRDTDDRDTDDADVREQLIVVRVWDVTEGQTIAEPMEGVSVVVSYLDGDGEVPNAVPGRTDGDGRSHHTTPAANYEVAVVTPPGFELVYTDDLGGIFAAMEAEYDEILHVVTMRRIPEPVTDEPATDVPEPATDEPATDTDEPATEEPATDTTDGPATEEPGAGTGTAVETPSTSEPVESEHPTESDVTIMNREAAHGESARESE